jgi:Zn-dependent protease with chaperone function
MIVAAALVAGALLLGWAGPGTLSKLGGHTNPGLELTWWLSLAAATVVSTGTGAVMLLLGDHPHLLTGPWQACWAIAGHTHIHPLDELTGAGLLALLCLGTARTASAVRRRVHRQRRAHRAHMTAVATHAMSRVDGVLWLEHDTPFAYSIAGRPGLIVASTALRHLPSQHRDAVLGHERHHLRHRHHWVVIATGALSDALPRIPLFRRTATAARTLTELSADDSAARRYGSDAVAAALTALGHREESTAQRLHRLSAPAAGRPGRLSMLAAGLTSSLVPAILGGVILGVLTTIAC